MEALNRIAFLEARVARVERENRRLRWWGRLGLAAVVFLALAFPFVRLWETRAMAPDLLDEVRTRRIHVQNEEGESGIVLSLSEKGDPCIGLFGRSGAPRAILCNTEDGATNLVLADGTGEDRVKVVVSREGIPALFLFDREGRNRLMMGVNSDGGPVLGLLDETRRPVWTPPLSPDGDGDQGSGGDE